MTEELHSRLEGDFNGYDEGNVYRLESGLVCQQTAHYFSYRYAYRPRVRVFQHGSAMMLEVEGMPTAVPVTAVDVLEDGAIVSDFKGFKDRDTLFQFQNGHVWQQAEYKYAYHYAYRPQATVVDGINGQELQVEGMDETVRVRRVR